MKEKKRVKNQKILQEILSQKDEVYLQQGTHDL